MIELKKILVATDFSDHARAALRHAVGLAQAFSSEVILCHVVESADWVSQIPPTGETYFPPNLPELQEQESRGLCQKLLTEFNVENGRYLLPHGSAFAEIVRTARAEDVDLIVIGTHGRGAVAHMLMGSVAERVVRKAPCPVLTVREGEHEFVHP